VCPPQDEEKKSPNDDGYDGINGKDVDADANGG
jgi:hypothetical protein